MYIVIIAHASDGTFGCTYRTANCKRSYRKQVNDQERLYFKIKLKLDRVSTTQKYLHVVQEADEQASNILQEMFITHKKRSEEQAEDKPEQHIG